MRRWLRRWRRRRLEVTIARLTRDHEQCEAVIQLFAKVTGDSPFGAESVQPGILMLEFVSRRMALAHAIENAEAELQRLDALGLPVARVVRERGSR